MMKVGVNKQHPRLSVAALMPHTDTKTEVWERKALISRWRLWPQLLWSLHLISQNMTEVWWKTETNGQKMYVLFPSKVSIRRDFGFSFRPLIKLKTIPLSVLFCYWRTVAEFGRPAEYEPLWHSNYKSWDSRPCPPHGGQRSSHSAIQPINVMCLNWWRHLSIRLLCHSPWSSTSWRHIKLL